MCAHEDDGDFKVVLLTMAEAESKDAESDRDLDLCVLIFLLLMSLSFDGVWGEVDVEVASIRLVVRICLVAK